MKQLLMFLLVLEIFAPTVWSAETESVPTKGRIVTTTVHSVVLGRDVALHAWLPPGYDAAANAETKYPVIYLFDGTKVFDAAGDSKEKKAHLDVALERMVGEGTLRPIVVVAIEQLVDYPARRDEYTVYRDMFLAPDGAEPHGQRLAEFMLGEVLPKITSAFRVSRERAQMGIGGMSYGGTAALYLLMRCPMTFGLGSIQSPSLQIGNGQLLRDSVHLFFCGNRVAIGVGTRECGTDEDSMIAGWKKGEFNRAFVRNCEILAANLREGVSPPVVQLEVEEGGEHNVEALARRLPKDLVFLFGTKP